MNYFQNEPTDQQYNDVATQPLPSLEPTQSEYNSIQSYAWENVQRAPVGPIDFGFGGGSSVSVSSAPKPSSDYGFPERVSVALAPIWEGLNYLTKAPQVALSNLKEIPGNPIGSALGAVGEGLGRAVEASGARPGLEKVGGIVGDAITSPFRSLGYILDTPARNKEMEAQGVRNIFDSPDPWAQFIHNAQSDVVHSELGAGADIVASITAAKLGKLGLSAAKGPVITPLKDFVGGVLSPEPMDLVGKEAVNIFGWLTGQGMRAATNGLERTTAEVAGKITGRATMALTAIGVVEQQALQYIAPQSEWAHTVAVEHMVPEGSMWEVPLDIALSAGLDIPGVIGAANSLRAGSKFNATAAKWALGTHPATVLNEVFGPEWEAAVKAEVVKEHTIVSIFNKAIDMAGEARLIDEHNLRLVGEDAVRVSDVKDLYYANQAGFDAAKRAAVGQIIKEEGVPGLMLRARDVVMGAITRTGELDDVRPGWKDLLAIPKEERLAQLDEYWLHGPAIQDALPERLARGATNQARQAPEALAFVKSLTEWTQDEKNLLGWKYPSLRRLIADTKDATVSAIQKVSAGAKSTTLTEEEIAARTGVKATAGKAATYVGETPGVRSGYTRLYRGENIPVTSPNYTIGAAERGKWFTTDAKYANSYTQQTISARKAGEVSAKTGTMAERVRKVQEAAAAAKAPGAPGKLYHIDVPTKSLDTYKVAASAAGHPEFVVSDALAAGKKEYVGIAAAKSQAEIDRLRLGKAVKTPEVVARPAEPSLLEKFGALAAERRVLAKQAIKDGTPLARLREVDSEISKLREGFTAKLKNTLEGAQITRDTRLAEIESGKLTGDALALATKEVATLDGKIADLSARYFDASLIGTRYELGFAPRTNYLSSVKPLSKFAIGQGRTPLGHLVDNLFGGIQNRVLSLEAFKSLRDAAEKAPGFSPTKYRKLLEEANLYVKEGTKEYPGGFQRSRYQSIWHIEPDKFRQMATRHLGEAPAGTSWNKIQYEAFPSPLKIFSKQVLGREVKFMPYNETFHSLTRGMYPMIRFYLSPRFILLNLAENSIYRWGFGGLKQFEALPPALEREVSMMGKEAKMGHAFIGAGDQVNTSGMGRMVASLRPSEVTGMVLETIHTSPMMQDLLRAEGVTTRKQTAEFILKLQKDRYAIMEATEHATPAEKRLSDEIGKINSRVATSAKEERDLRKLLDDKHTEYSALVLARRQKAFTAGWKPEFDPLLQAQWAHEVATVNAARQIMHGNPSRNAAERILNSYAVYWPLSYQLRAGKIMFKFMLDRGFGYKTNATIGEAYYHLNKWHEDRMKTDAEYAKFFKDNKQMLFILKQFFPTTPDETGVTLSPVLRLPLQVARGYRSPQQALERAFKTGVVGDVSLFTDILKEQTKKGGFFHDLFEGMKEQ